MATSGTPDPLRIPTLAQGHLHEIHASASALAAALAFALTAIDPAGAGNREPILLARAPRRAALSMRPCGEGLAGLGLDPARLLIVETRDDLALLRAGLDAARCRGLAAVVMETWGTLREYDLTASRRLVLAAEHSRVPVIVLRGEGLAGIEPRASAAHSRWRIACARSVPLAARAPGLPAIEAELLRQRGGRAGLRWRLTWDDEHGCFREDRTGIGAPATSEPRPAPLSGAVVPLARLRAGQASDHAGADHAARAA